MESIQYEEEEQILSENSKKQRKIKNFKQYLVDSQTIQHFVKFLFGLRAKQINDEGVPNQDALQLFRQYFGSLNPDTTQQNALKQQIQAVRSQNKSISEEINNIKEEIHQKRTQIQKAKQEKRLREQEQAKNPKKAGKK